ncbi:hypothetical protein NL108_001659 [Boleophthalmus pectinirostris]|nr:hypothetical protein NL108_001659 [Boleophthalmus pectinirostris]
MQPLSLWMSPFSSALASCRELCSWLCSDRDETKDCFKETSIGLRSMGLRSKELRESPTRSMRRSLLVMPLSQESVLCSALVSSTTLRPSAPPVSPLPSGSWVLVVGAVCSGLGSDCFCAGGGAEGALLNLAHPLAPPRSDTAPSGPGAGLWAPGPSAGGLAALS